ncbi:L-type lectin-domain containing receptor kinase IX.1-like [Telopea speciosissima]|uniref:L-type lectin-domain containing receptor kinase IX.1-like n=1 Tax=Telopea speciosissima TaxID=54955 RepID=UPI001CC71469|nr:L-type lectin-domain containing receptor kinase IX.1-like [Telopea speciosissima]
MNLLGLVLLQISIFFFRLIHSANSTSFNFTSFQSNTADINFEGDAHVSGNIIQLTKNQTNIANYGRATYTQPVQLWDSTTGMLADFNTHCTFLINGDTIVNGLAFFFAPNGSTAPPNSTGGFLGLVNTNSTTAGKFIAMEYDTHQDTWDPSNNHVGMNIGSIISDQTLNWNTTMTNKLANAWLSYDASTLLLSLYLTYVANPVFSGETTLTKSINLKDYLTEWVTIGFSAGTSTSTETQNIYSWQFSSSFNTGAVVGTSSKNKVGLVVGIVVGSVVLIIGLSLIGYLFVLRKGKRGKEESDVAFELAMEDEFEKGTGPRKFSYHELVKATENFNDKRKLGEGGFGGVYKGFLSDLNMDVAVKRVSKGSKQGVKEYVSEIKVISRLRHRNLVQLVGWCHERGDLLLVYEYMEKASLDFHIFRGTITMLPWEIRHKIAHGLASALLYLHEEWEQCVVHRDIKSSNVMLDSNFNAKLGDFGLARLVDHQLGSQTTVLAGTMGYMAPECVTTGKASKESDVYSFGVVALEIACGRRAVEHKEESSKVALVAWVWELYGSGRLLEAVDPRLEMDFDEKQMERLLVVGLWCAHLDPSLRPSIRQAINVLSFETEMPNLPSKMSMPSYFSPLLNSFPFSHVSSNDTATTTTTDAAVAAAREHQTQYSTSTCTTTDSSMPTMSSFASSSGSPATLLYDFKKTNI